MPSFSSPGLGVIYTPLNHAHAPISVNIDGGGTGYHLVMTQSINGAPFALLFDAAHQPISIYSPGCYTFNRPFTPTGQAGARYQLVCRVLGSGTVSYNFSS